MSQRSTSSFHILAVCTGNICRSPIAEALFQKAFASAPDVYVSSAGLEALVGSRMDAQAAEQLVRLEGDPRGLTSEQFEELHARNANLVLTMSLEQREQVIRDFPRVALRTFTLTEFANLSKTAVAQQGGPLPLAELLSFARKHRGSHKVTKADDVQDPFKQLDSVHEATADHIQRLVSEIVDATAEAH